MSVGKLLYFDCSTGAAGDMLLASMLDCGLPLEKLNKGLASLPLSGYVLNTFRKSSGGISGLQFKVEVKERQALRLLPEIENLICSSDLPKNIQEKSLKIFQTLAKAEAAVHGIPEDKVHFHEIGALDSILDIVGSVIVLDLLAVEQVYASPLPLGRGWAKSGHGSIPLPAPATMEIIKNCQIPCYGIGLSEETVTPTGAAILGTICTAFMPIPSLRIENIGYGVGQKDFGYPNLVRAYHGTYFSPGSNACGDNVSENPTPLFTAPLDIIEANVDDLNPEIYDYVFDCLFSDGALDVYFTPIQMKKNRPGLKLTVLAKPGDAEKIGQVLLRETTTLGFRRYSAQKTMLPRKQITARTPWGDVRVKVGGVAPEYHNIAPEYEDCRQIARTKKIPLKKVYQAVWRALG